MTPRSILWAAAIAIATYAASFLIAMTSAGIAIAAFLSGDDMPSIADVATYSVVGIAAFSVPLSLLMTIGILTCGTTKDELLTFWPSCTTFVSAMAPAIGSAILDAPVSTVSVLFSGCFVALVILVGALMVSLLLFGLCIRYCIRHEMCGWFPQRRSRWSSHSEDLSIDDFPSVSDSSNTSEHTTTAEPPRVPYVVIDHPGGELHIGRGELHGPRPDLQKQ